MLQVGFRYICSMCICTLESAPIFAHLCAHIHAPKHGQLWHQNICKATLKIHEKFLGEYS